MGIASMMKVVFIAALALVAVEGMNQDPPITAQEITEMIIPAVAGMQKPLTQMKDIEEAEIAEMKDVAQTVDRVQDHPATQKEVANAAARIELDTDKGMVKLSNQHHCRAHSSTSRRWKRPWRGTLP